MTCPICGVTAYVKRRQIDPTESSSTNESLALVACAKCAAVATRIIVGQHEAEVVSGKETRGGKVAAALVAQTTEEAGA